MEQTLTLDRPTTATDDGDRKYKLGTDAGDAVWCSCNIALSRLGAIMTPRTLEFNNMYNFGPIGRGRPPKFSSPLKRQPLVQFHFTESDALSDKLRNKVIIRTLIDTLFLEDVGINSTEKPQDHEALQYRMRYW